MPKLPFNLSSRLISPVRTNADASQFGLPVLGSIGEFERRAGWLLPSEAFPEALEAYEQLIHAIRMPDFHLRGYAIVVATVPGGAGGTTTAQNLAALLSQSGRKTIAVDSNVKRVGRRRAGDGTASNGFAGLLMNQLMRPAKSLVETDDPRLKLLPAGSMGGPADALLRSPKLPRVVDGLRDLADYVVFDAGSVTEDLAALTRLADVTLLVLRSGRTRRKDAMDAVMWLREQTPGLMGIVLNRSPLAPTPQEEPARPVLTVVPEAGVPAELRLEIAVDDLLADLEEAVSLIRELRSPGQTEDLSRDELVAADG